MPSHHRPLYAALSNLRHGLHPVAACLLALALSACGGGSDAEPQRAAASAEASSQPSMVLFTGCVVDQYFVPNTGVPVRALGADGRLLGSARSGQAGEFRLRLPADARVAVQVDADDGESMPVQTNRGNQQVARCLVARAT